MIIIHTNEDKIPLDEYQKSTFFVTKSYGGLLTLQFDINPKVSRYKYIFEEARLEYDGKYYNVKTINERTNVSTVTAELDIDDFRDKVWASFTVTTLPLSNILDKALEGSGWSVVGADVIPNRRSVELNDVNRWNVLEYLTNSTMFDIAYDIDNINKVLTIIRPMLINEPTGVYFTDELNLKECTHKGTSTDLVTRLYAYGKDGLSIALYNENKEYVENHDYTDKVISSIWRDDRYTDPESLRDDAIEKLKTMAVPTSSYTCKIVDLAKIKPDKYSSILSYNLYDMVTLINRYQNIATNYRIVQTKEYPHCPELNEASLNSVSAKITTKMSNILQSVNEINIDNIIAREKVNEISRTVEANVIAISERYTKGETDTAIDTKITQTASEIRTEVSNVKKDLSDDLATAESAISENIADTKKELLTEISQTESAITSTVYSHLTNGATNYIANPKDFENLTDWKKSYANDWTMECTDGVIKLTKVASTGSTPYIYALLSESVLLKINEKNYVTLSMRIVANTDCRVYLSRYRAIGTNANALGVIAKNEIAASNIISNYIDLKADDTTTIYAQIKNTLTDSDVYLNGIGLYMTSSDAVTTGCPIGTKIEIQYIQLTDTNTTDTRMTSIEQRADSIVSEVSKKVNDVELSTKISQLPTAVQIAWNTISKVIQFASAQLQIYDADDDTSKLLFTLGLGGMNWYNRMGYNIGSIGRKYYADTNYQAMNLTTGEQGDYLSLSAQYLNDESMIKLMYSKNGGPAIMGWHFFDKIYLQNYPLYFGTSSTSLRTIVSDDGSGFQNGSGGDYFTIFNPDVAPMFKVTNSRITCYNTLDMSNFSIINQSDARLKTNIKNCNINALDVINSFELKEFDWLTDNSHENIGVIAQQVQEVAPELIHESEDGILSIKSDKFIWYAIKAIQELSSLLNVRSEKKLKAHTDYYDYSDEEKTKYAEKCKIKNANLREPIQSPKNRSK